MNRLVVALALPLLIAGCGSPAPGTTSRPKDNYRVGETAFVCGCRPGCCACDIIARTPGGKCGCNRPLLPGTVLRVKGEVISVKLGNREKTIFLR